MNKYVVALYSNFDGTIVMDEITATSKVEACKKFLGSEYEVDEVMDMEEMRQAMFNQDHSIEVIELYKHARAGRSGDKLQPYLAQLDSESRVQ